MKRSAGPGPGRGRGGVRSCEMRINEWMKRIVEKERAWR